MASEPVSSQRVIAVRDSKDPDGPKLFFEPGAWTELLNRVKAGELELPEELRRELDERFLRPEEREGLATSPDA